MCRFALAPVALLAVAACGGGNLCQKYADELESCDDAGEFSVEECEAEIAPCDNQDRKLLDEFYQCASDEGLFACDAEMTATNMTEAFEMMADIFACAEPLEDLSEECQGSMMTGSTNATFF